MLTEAFLEKMIDRSYCLGDSTETSFTLGHSNWKYSGVNFCPALVVPRLNREEDARLDVFPVWRGGNQARLLNLISSYSFILSGAFYPEVMNAEKVHGIVLDVATGIQYLGMKTYMICQMLCNCILMTRMKRRK